MREPAIHAALAEADEKWGAARVVQGLRDPAFLRQHREEIVARIIAQGGAKADAESFVSLRIAAAEGTLMSVELGSGNAA